MSAQLKFKSKVAEGVTQYCAVEECQPISVEKYNYVHVYLIDLVNNLFIVGEKYLMSLQVMLYYLMLLLMPPATQSLSVCMCICWNTQQYSTIKHFRLV